MEDHFLQVLSPCQEREFINHEQRHPREHGIHWARLLLVSGNIKREKVGRWAWRKIFSGQTQKSTATSDFHRLELLKNLKRKLTRLLLENAIKIALGKKNTNQETSWITIIKFPVHMRRTRVRDCPTFGLKARGFKNLWMCQREIDHLFRFAKESSYTEAWRQQWFI